MEKTMRCLVLTALAVSLFYNCRAAAEEFVSVNASPFEWTMENPGDPGRPAVQIVGVTDESGKHTLGPEINGVRLADELLTGSILIIRPDGTGTWKYDTGFKDYPLKLKGKLAHDVDANKYKHDIFAGDYLASEVSGDNYCSQRLWLASGKPRKAVYRIGFPESVKIKKLEVKFVVSDNGETPTGFPELYFGLYKDVDCKEELTKLVRSEGQGKNSSFNPCVFNDINRNLIYLSISSNGKGGINIYNVEFNAVLDTSGLELPLLESGSNTLKYTDDINSSHQAKIKCRVAGSGEE